jgi:hypothetical protein
MDNKVSIILSTERSSYRKVAQEWYGLTDEQMIDMDVHHNPPRHEGGRNIPEHLFVYHKTLHAAVHGDEFVLWARKGAEKANAEKDELGRSVAAMKSHAEKDELGKSILAVRRGKKGAKKLNAKKDEFGRSLMAVKGASCAHAEKDKYGRSKTAVKAAEGMNSKKDEFGRSLASLKGAASLHATRWEDPDHPELGHKPPGILVCMQKSRGLPHGPENRRRAG